MKKEFKEWFFIGLFCLGVNTACVNFTGPLEATRVPVLENITPVLAIQPGGDMYVTTHADWLEEHNQF